MTDRTRLVDETLRQLPPVQAERFSRLLDGLSAMRRAVVAFSGGIDSAFLAVAAWLALGDQMLAVTIHSPVHIEEDDSAAATVAGHFGFPFRTVEHNDLESEHFTINPANRCYICKLARFHLLKEFAAEKGYPYLLEGSNADDLNDHRPGAKAVSELSVRSPLQEFGYTKDEIRQVSHLLGIPVWDRPPSPCLATRIPFGTPIRLADLQTVSHAEEHLRRAGYTHVRVRYQAPVARIEVQPEQVERLVRERESIVTAFKALGIRSILLDLEGYRSGKLSEEIGGQ
ncbi:MAG: ATP-dependent sacrificial sulfur transferase LarE [Anaerolineae bacterium]|nr:ATP-dependent sacrificial sulfur transferase LarE [Anaerolineae bacterium]